MFNLFPLCRKDEISFDIVAETGNILFIFIYFHCCNIVAKNGNNVEETLDFIERIVRLVAFIRQCCFDIVAGVEWTGLKTCSSAVAAKPARRAASRQTAKF